MKENDFFIWLQDRFNEHTSSSRISNCRRVEEFEGDLDNHYVTDQCKNLLTRLTYSKKDEASNRKPKHRIPINGNIYNGTATFRAAVNLYIKFKSGVSNPINHKPQHQKQAINYKKNNQWPDWDKPSDDELYEIISITLRYVKFLRPDIIQRITEDNNSHSDEWREKLQNKEINPEIYMWEKSPCAFPGIRRHAGAEEIANFKNKANSLAQRIKNAICLDDNSYPKEIWSFTFRDKEFQNSGPDGYALAHLADHKTYKNRASDDFNILIPENSHELFGLFTCPTNTVFIPTSLIKPTDFSSEIRRILIYKAYELYSKYCNLLPPWIELLSETDNRWHHSNFIWSETVGTMENIGDFIDYRNDIMGRLFK